MGQPVYNRMNNLHGAKDVFRSLLCGYVLQGRDTPSPGDTPYLCRQRNSFGSFNNRLQELNEMEQGALLSNGKTCGCDGDAPPTTECTCPIKATQQQQQQPSVSKESCVWQWTTRNAPLQAKVSDIDDYDDECVM